MSTTSGMNIRFINILITALIVETVQKQLHPRIRDISINEQNPLFWSVAGTDRLRHTLPYLQCMEVGQVSRISNLQMAGVIRTT